MSLRNALRITFDQAAFKMPPELDLDVSALDGVLGPLRALRSGVAPTSTMDLSHYEQ